MVGFCLRNLRRRSLILVHGPTLSEPRRPRYLIAMHKSVHLPVLSCSILLDSDSSMLVLSNCRFCDQSSHPCETFDSNLHITIYFGIWQETSSAKHSSVAYAVILLNKRKTVITLFYRYALHPQLSYNVSAPAYYKSYSDNY